MAIYARVKHYLPWIKSTVNKLGRCERWKDQKNKDNKDNVNEDNDNVDNNNEDINNNDDETKTITA